MGLIVSLISYIISINKLFGFIHEFRIIGDMVEAPINYVNLSIVILITLISIYVITLIIQKIINYNLVRLLLGIGILTFGLILFPDTVKHGIEFIPFIITLGLFFLAIFLFGTAVKNYIKK